MSVNKYDKINNRLLPFAGNGGGGGSAGIRYDEETDTVQLFYEGEWVDWKTAGLAYPVGTQTTFSYKGSVDAFEIPATGYWALEKVRRMKQKVVRLSFMRNYRKMILCTFAQVEQLVEQLAVIMAVETDTLAVILGMAVLVQHTQP